jgi:hypothetical protein
MEFAARAGRTQHDEHRVPPVLDPDRRGPQPLALGIELEPACAEIRASSTSLRGDKID